MEAFGVVAAGLTSPLWIWIPLGSYVANVFYSSPPKHISPSFKRYIDQEHSHRCFAKPYNKYFREKLDQVRTTLAGYNEMEYNIGLCGERGVGKSSMCNAILGLTDKAPGAAVVGVVEVTHQAAKYRSAAALPHVTVWDLPGAGTQAHSATDYYHQKCLYACDAILVVTKDTIKQVDIDIIRTAQAIGQEVAIVRTHAECHIRNMMRTDEDLTPEGAAFKLKAMVVKNVNQELSKARILPCQAFIVDRWAFTCPRFYSRNGIDLKTENCLLDEGDLLQFLGALTKNRT